MLLRIGCSQAALEELATHDDEATLLNVCERLFPDRNGGPHLDLNPSVYELDGPEQVTQAHAEHAGAARLDFKTLIHLDLNGLGPPPVRTPGTGRFVFTRERHREIHVENRDALVDLMRRVRQAGGGCKHKVTRAQLREYVRQRLAAGDPEWVECCAEQPGRWAAAAEA